MQGALLVLPPGFAFEALAGLPPEYGLHTAIAHCAIAALFGSIWYVVSGQTNSNSLALFAMLSPLELVGLMQSLIGALRFGSIANFISPAALRGFMTGASALISRMR